MTKKTKKKENYDIISSIADSNLMTADKFSDLVEAEFLKARGAITILEAMVIIVDRYLIDYAKIKKLMLPDLKKKIEAFSKNHNLIKKNKNLLDS